MQLEQVASAIYSRTLMHGMFLWNVNGMIQHKHPPPLFFENRASHIAYILQDDRAIVRHVLFHCDMSGSNPVKLDIILFFFLKVTICDTCDVVFCT